jgi:hypothetical protein
MADSHAEYRDARIAMERNLRGMCVQFVEDLRGVGCGRIEWFGEDSCRFDYPVAHVRAGIVANDVTTVRHTHDLVNARQHKLPAVDVPRPQIVDTIIAKLPSAVLPHLRIVSGLEVAKRSRMEGNCQQPSAFGKHLLDLGFMTPSFSPAIPGVGALSEAPTRIAACAAAVGRAVAVALADPALCWGDLVLIGWELE